MLRFARSCVLALLLATTAFAEEGAGLKSVSELGIVSTGGNSSSLSLNVKQDLSYEWPSDVLKARASYLKTQSGDVDTARSWLLGARYERVISEGFNAFAAQTIEGDPFVGYLQRYSTDAGAKYYLRKREYMQWFVEGGYRYQSTNNLTKVQSSTDLARLYTEYTRNFTPSAGVRFWLEYLPRLSHLSDYQLNTETSLIVSIGPTLSVKMAYLIRYNSVPTGVLGKSTDTTLTNSLVAQF